MRTLENKRVGRRLPVGAEPVGRRRIQFRLWLLRTSVHVLTGRQADCTEAEQENGYFSGMRHRPALG